MNYLAHLHIAKSCQSSLLGNLLGDFIKGNPEKRFPAPVVQGIQLHRFVDTFTDQHPEIHQVKSLFTGSARRFAPVALDVFWDHCLSVRWSDFGSVRLEKFCEETHAQIHQSVTFSVPEYFSMVHQRMWHGKWLESYGDMENIELVLNRMSSRSPRLHALQCCYPFFEIHYDTLMTCFTRFYPMVLSASDCWMKNYPLPVCPINVEQTEM